MKRTKIGSLQSAELVKNSSFCWQIFCYSYKTHFLLQTASPFYFRTLLQTNFWYNRLRSTLYCSNICVMRTFEICVVLQMPCQRGLLYSRVGMGNVWPFYGSYVVLRIIYSLHWKHSSIFTSMAPLQASLLYQLYILVAFTFCPCCNYTATFFYFYVCYSIGRTLQRTTNRTSQLYQIACVSGCETYSFIVPWIDRDV